MTRAALHHAGAAAYDASSIVVLPELEAVRRNPSMYVGSTDAHGLHHLAFELIDNAVDESAAGFCSEISLRLHADGSCTIEDDGRGIPVDIHPQTGRPACEVVLTALHSGAKFDKSSYATTAGLHGVGLSCVNALSERLLLEVWRDGHHHRQAFSRGVPAGGLERVAESERRGTRIRFRPDRAIFGACALSSETLIERLDEIAFLHPGLRVQVADEQSGLHLLLARQDGVRGLLQHRNRDATLVHPSPIVVSYRAGAIAIDVAVQWTEGYACDVRSFVNGVRTEHGGSHVDGLRTALARAVSACAAAHPSAGDLGHPETTAADAAEGMTAVIAVRAAEPRFDGQTKRRLASPELGSLVERVVAQAVTAELDTDRVLAGRILERVVDAARARLAARRARGPARMQRRDVRPDPVVYQRQFGIRSRNWHDSCAWLTDAGLLAGHAALCDVAPDAQLLDVCCGSGVVGHAFKHRVGHTVGLDITPEMVRIASTRLDQVHQGTVYDLPFDDASFDLVVNREVLHLLPTPERPLAEMFRVLRPGGQLVVGQIVPYGAEDAFWMFRIFKKKQPLLFHMFREEEFRRLLLGAGFGDLVMEEYLLWESIDRWIDTHETTTANRQDIIRLFHDAPAEVRAVHPFEVAPDGSVRDRWRWCIYSLRKPR